MIIDLTALEIAKRFASGRSDGGGRGDDDELRPQGKPGKEVFLVASECHPQTIDVVKTPRPAFGESKCASRATRDFKLGPDVFGALVQYPATDGAVIDYSKTVEQVHAADALLTVAADILSLVLLTPPGEWGADIVVRESCGRPIAGVGTPTAAYSRRPMSAPHCAGRPVSRTRLSMSAATVNRRVGGGAPALRSCCSR